MSVTVRPGHSGDISRILAMLFQNGGLHHKLRPDVFRENACKYDAASLAELLSMPSRPVLIADDGGEAVGYAMCELRSTKGHPILADRSVLYIEDLCVDAQRRRQGTGKLLFCECKKLAQTHGCDAIELNVWQDNADAMRFYEGLGFKTQKRGMELNDIRS